MKMEEIKIDVQETGNLKLPSIFRIDEIWRNLNMSWRWWNIDEEGTNSSSPCPILGGPTIWDVQLSSETHGNPNQLISERRDLVNFKALQAEFYDWFLGNRTTPNKQSPIILVD